VEQFQPALRRIRFWILSSAALLLVVGGAVLTLVPVDESVRATGTVVAEEEAYLYAPDDAVIEKVHAPEGTDVKTGDIVLTLDKHDLQNRSDQIVAELKESEAQAEFKKNALERITKLPLPKEFWHAQTELASAEQKARHAAAERERYQGLFKSGLTSETELSARKLADQLAQADLTNARDKVRVVQAGLEESITKEALADLKSGLARVERLKIDLAVCERDIDRRSLRAPVDGKVTLLLKRRTGERVAQGEELVHLSQGAATRARLSVGEPQIHRIHVGQQVQMKTPVFSPIRHGYIRGQVEEVALEPYPRQSGEASYRVNVRIAETPMPLVLGATLDAEIILRRVPIWRMLLPADLE